MYAGHFAAALALKAQVPRAPTCGLLVGVGVLDILFGPFVLAGIERVSLTPGISPGFSLDHIDWSHSLVMSVVWSILFGAAFLHPGRRVAAGCWYYWHRSRGDRSFGGRALAVVAIILVLHLLNSPWLSAM